MNRLRATLNLHASLPSRVRAMASCHRLEVGMVSMLIAAMASTGIVVAAEMRVTAQELIDQGAQRLGAAEVKALLVSGAAVETVAGSSGNVRQWTHGSDGQFVASSRGPMGTQTTGQGTWRVADDGQYCVEIKWKTVDEQWCRAVYTYASATYLAPVNLARNADKQFVMLRVSGQGIAPQTVAASQASTSRIHLTKAELEQMLGGKSFTFKDDGSPCIRFNDGASGCGYYFKDGDKLQRTRSNTPTDPVIAYVEKIE